MKLFTTEKERKIKMGQLRPVSKLEKILFPIVVTIVVWVPRTRHIVKAQKDCAEVCGENTELSRRTQQKALGIGNQRTEVRHGAHAHEDQGRQDRCRSPGRHGGKR